MKVLLIQEQDRTIVKIPMPGTNLEELAAGMLNARIVDQSELPTDREFRDAWTVFGTVDLEKAKDVWRQKIRAVRNKRLEDLDIKWMRAMEKGELRVAESVAADKQVLRSLPQREEISRARNLAELKSFWPSILEG